MDTSLRRATAVAIAAITTGTIVLLDAVRPGMGISLLVLAVALFAAGGVNEAYRLLWLPFAALGAFLTALNFTPLTVSSEPTGLALYAIGLGALLLAVGGNRLRSVAGRRPWRRTQGRR